jgi:hypothetical protein
MYPDRAVPDFDEMIDHGCNAVLLAVSEFDWWFWRRNVSGLISAAHERGLRAYVDLWGWGKTLAGEPPSIFLMRDTYHRQHAASGRIYDAVCLNHQGFKDFLEESIAEMASETEADGFFWDEPHYANWHDPDWACRCPICRGLYEERTGEPMPGELTPEVIAFREDRAVSFLRELSQAVKGRHHLPPPHPEPPHRHHRLGEDRVHPRGRRPRHRPLLLPHGHGQGGGPRVLQGHRGEGHQPGEETREALPALAPGLPCTRG